MILGSKKKKNQKFDKREVHLRCTYIFLIVSQNVYKPINLNGKIYMVVY